MKLTRTDYQEHGIFGELQLNEVMKLVTLEHAYHFTLRPDGSFDWEPKVPEGKYTCVRRNSPRFARDVFMLTGVPGHEFIEIHWGNVQEDSSGCLLLGLWRTGNLIVKSRDAFNMFMSELTGINQFELEIIKGEIK